MLSQRTTECFVGLFLLIVIVSLITLAFKVSGLTSFLTPKSYQVTAEFADIGNLKVRSPIKISGVAVGEISAIKLDPVTFKAILTLRIENKFNKIPDDSSASILTSGLLGDNYIEINPMYSTTFLKDGSNLEDTHSAMILEKLIGQLIYKLGSGEKDNKAQAKSVSPLQATTPQTLNQ